MSTTTTIIIIILSSLCTGNGQKWIILPNYCQNNYLYDYFDFKITCYQWNSVMQSMFYVAVHFSMYYN